MRETLEWLEARIGLNFRSGLARMEQAVELLGQPQDSYPIIHVTGTNGKGSTIAFLLNLFCEQGKKVGTFTSPHLVSVHDRICINGQAISDAEFIRLAHQVQELEAKLTVAEGQLSYFEVLTLMALLYFRQQKVDVVLLEVGIGGLLDTTNVVTGEIAVITSVGLDHQETLGATIAEIAEQKAGIFKRGQKAVIGPLAKEAQQLCRQVAHDLDVSLYEYGQDFSLQDGKFSNQAAIFTDLHLGLAGAHQRENAAVALEAFLLFMEERSEFVETATVRSALAKTYWAGRLEELLPGLYLDGAHNLPALARLVEFIKSQEEQEIFLLFGALKRKDYAAMLAFLQQELPAAHLSLTSFSYGESVGKKEIPDVAYVADYRAFIETFIKVRKPQQLLFVTGSLYFISEVRAIFAKGASN